MYESGPVKDRVQDVIRESRLPPDKGVLLTNLVNRDIPRVRRALRVITERDLLFHFTPEGFTFHPHNKKGRQIFLEGVNTKRWLIEDRAASGIEVTTWNIEHIRYNGLRQNSCIAFMPGLSGELMKYHPRLFIEALKGIVEKFGKHSTPYKERFCYSQYGTLSDIRGGLIVMSGDVEKHPKNKDVREALTINNLTRAATYIVDEGVSPDHILAIARFYISQPFISTNGKLVIDRKSLSQNIWIGLCESLPNILREGLGDERVVVQKVLARLQRVSQINVYSEVFR